MKDTMMMAAWLIALPVLAAEEQWEEEVEDTGLFIEVGELSSEEELRARIAEEFGEDAEVEVPAGVSNLLDALDRDAPDDVQDALLDLAGRPAQIAGEPEHDDHAPALPQLSTEEILSRMSSERVELLSPHESLLDSGRSMEVDRRLGRHGTGSEECRFGVPTSEAPPRTREPVFRRTTAFNRGGA